MNKLFENQYNWYRHPTNKAAHWNINGPRHRGLAHKSLSLGLYRLNTVHWALNTARHSRKLAINKLHSDRSVGSKDKLSHLYRRGNKFLYHKLNWFRNLKTAYSHLKYSIPQNRRLPLCCHHHPGQFRKPFVLLLFLEGKLYMTVRKHQ